MASLYIVLRDDALVDDPLLIKEVCGDGLLQKCIADVLLIRQDLLQRACQPVMSVQKSNGQSVVVYGKLSYNNCSVLDKNGRDKTGQYILKHILKPRAFKTPEKVTLSQ